MLIPSLSKWNVVTFSINKAKCLWLNAWNHSFLIVVVDIRGKWRCYKLPDALKQNKPSKRRKNAFLPKKKKKKKKKKKNKKKQKIKITISINKKKKKKKKDVVLLKKRLNKK